MKKRIVSFLLLISIFVSICPYNKEAKAVENVKQENKYGYVESKLKVYEQPSKFLKDSNNLPSKFDLRDEGGVTPIKNQNPYGTCWAFASMSMAESNLKYKTGKEEDFSELNLAIDRVGINGLNKGGNFSMGLSYFANGIGPVLEKDHPYPPAGQVVDKKAPAAYSVKDVQYLSKRKNSLDNYEIKEAIMENGAVGISYNHQDAFLANDGVSYYYNASTITNHAVTLIGWDDNYQKEKFKNTPAGNGAFLVKNSWGEWFGDKGYFYISYYDTSLGNNLISTTDRVENIKSQDNKYIYGKYDNNYPSNGTIQDQFIANTHITKGNELISDVSIYTFSTNADYEVYIDEDYKEANYPNGNINYLLGKKRKSGTFKYAGINTIKLDKTVEVNAGKKFMVAVKYKDVYVQQLSFIDDEGKTNSFEINGNILRLKNNVANPLTVYSYNKNQENIKSINTDKQSINMKIGEKSQVKATVGDINLKNQTLKWTSSNEKVAVVDENGIIKAKKNGNAVIKVSNRANTIMKNINVLVNTDLIRTNDLNTLIPGDNVINFNDSIKEGIDYSKIVLKDSNDNIIPITKKIENKNLYIQVNNKYLGEGKLYIPKASLKNTIEKSLKEDQIIKLSINTYDLKDKVNLKSKDLIKAIAKELNKNEDEIVYGDLNGINNLNIEQDSFDFKDIGVLKNLKYLKVSCKSSCSNVQDLKSLTNLHTVDFLNVNMINLNYLKNNSQLEDLYVRNSRLFSLEGIENLKNVRSIDISNNYINNINGIENLKLLETAYLNYNKLTDINLIGNCEKLERLDISHNNIKSLQGIEKVKNIKKIEATRNRIQDLNLLQNQISLESIDVTNNEINDVTAMSKLSNLNKKSITLYISNNYINEDNEILKDLKINKNWQIENYGARPYLYEIADNNSSSVSSSYNKRCVYLEFNRPINKDWKVKIYKFLDDGRGRDIPFTIKDNKINIGKQDENSTIGYEIKYVNQEGSNSTSYNRIKIEKPEFYVEDVNRDKNIDIKDLASVASKYNEKAVGEIENWEYYKDVNLDGVIDIYDIVMVSKAM